MFISQRIQMKRDKVFLIMILQIRTSSIIAKQKEFFLNLGSQFWFKLAKFSLMRSSWVTT